VVVLRIRQDGELKSVSFKGGTVLSLLCALELSREEALVKVNGKLASESAEIRQKDKVEIVKVVLGG
jgi:sulfur carrier protein ThiS